MPSSNKTSNLNLNSWIGSDKPKRDDFVSDNQKIDSAYGSVQNTLQTHCSNTELHVSANERERWNTQKSFSSFTFVGDGTPSRSIPLGVYPSMGFIFAVGKGVCQPIFATSNLYVYAGFFSQAGNNKGISLDTNGIVVNYDLLADPDGYAHRFNEAGVTYVVVYFS